jgi:uncharacterized YccA/Bax inhibitor family protein
MALRTSNPTLRGETFNRYAYLTGTNPAERMTLAGTLNKCIILLALAIGTAGLSWYLVANSRPLAFPILISSGIIGLVLALVASFKPQAAPTVAPIYALVEGFFLGVTSYILNTAYPGIVLQAIPITFGVMLAMLALYRAGILRATPTFVKVVVLATAAIALVYVVNLGMMLFGVRMPFLHDATPLGIAISLGICVVAALNFILDFDLIEQGSEQGAPKFMEWYGAFALMVTLFWLYVEILRLLSKLRR